MRLTVPLPPLAQSLYSVYRLCLFFALDRNALSFSIGVHTSYTEIILNVLNHQDILKTAVAMFWYIYCLLTFLVMFLLF